MIIKYNNHLVRIEKITFIDYKIPIQFFIGNNQVIVSNVFFGDVYLSLIQNNKTETVELKLNIENYPYGSTYVNATMSYNQLTIVPSLYEFKVENKIFCTRIISMMVWFIHGYKF